MNTSQSNGSANVQNKIAKRDSIGNAEKNVSIMTSVANNVKPTTVSISDKTIAIIRPAKNMNPLKGNQVSTNAIGQSGDNVNVVKPMPALIAGRRVSLVCANNKKLLPLQAEQMQQKQQLPQQITPELPNLLQNKRLSIIQLEEGGPKNKPGLLIHRRASISQLGEPTPKLLPASILKRRASNVQPTEVDPKPLPDLLVDRRVSIIPSNDRRSSIIKSNVGRGSIAQSSDQTAKQVPDLMVDRRASIIPSSDGKISVVQQGDRRGSVVPSDGQVSKPLPGLIVDRRASIIQTGDRRNSVAVQNDRRGSIVPPNDASNPTASSTDQAKKPVPSLLVDTRTATERRASIIAPGEKIPVLVISKSATNPLTTATTTSASSIATNRTIFPVSLLKASRPVIISNTQIATKKVLNNGSVINVMEMPKIRLIKSKLSTTTSPNATQASEAKPNNTQPLFKIAQISSGADASRIIENNKPVTDSKVAKEPEASIKALTSKIASAVKQIPIKVGSPVWNRFSETQVANSGECSAKTAENGIATSAVETKRNILKKPLKVVDSIEILDSSDDETTPSTVQGKMQPNYVSKGIKNYLFCESNLDLGKILAEVDEDFIVLKIPWPPGNSEPNAVKLKKANVHAFLNKYETI